MLYTYINMITWYPAMTENAANADADNKETQ